MVKFKTDMKKYWWFRLSDRPIHLNNNFRMYRYRSTSIFIFQIIIRSFLNNYDKELRGAWDKDGSIIIPELFNWWWNLKINISNISEKTVGEVIQIKINIYKYYFRRVNKKSNYG